MKKLFVCLISILLLAASSMALAWEEKDIRVDDSWNSNGSYCISSVDESINLEKAQMLYAVGQITLIYFERKNGEWKLPTSEDVINAYNLEVDINQINKKTEKLREVLNKAIEPKTHFLLEWWHEHDSWRVYFKPEISKQEKILQIYIDDIKRGLRK